MKALSHVLVEAAKLVTPGPSDSAKVEALAQELLARTSAAASIYPEARGALLGGSFAKGTWLPSEVDLDIFVRFDPSTPEDRFEKLGLAVGAEATRGHPRGKKFAQHPYTEATVDGVKVNVVPCYEVRDRRWKSAADRSPFHVDLVKALSAEAKTEVRLLKKFMKGVGVYGAEIQTRGFSGYVAEVLVMQQRSFVAVLRWFAGLAPLPRVRVFRLPDPVDEGRDLGIAVSGEKLGTMVLASRGFLSRPSLAYFGRMRGRPRLKLRQSVLALVFSHRRRSEDILWGELRRSSRHIVLHLEAEGFRIARTLSASNNVDRSAILLVPEYFELPPLEQRAGPTVDREADVSAFLRSNRRASKLVWVDDEARVRLLVPRRYLRLTDLLRDMARGRLGPTGASRELEKAMRKSGSVLSGARLAREASRSPWLGDGLREITSDVLGTGPS